jgi:hypothetical protein
MSDRKLNSAIQKHVPTPVFESQARGGIALQLRIEIDKLALLLEEVKRQSERIQAAADDIGQKLQLNSEGESPANERATSRARARQGRLLRFSSTSTSQAPAIPPS